MNLKNAVNLLKEALKVNRTSTVTYANSLIKNALLQLGEQDADCEDGQARVPHRPEEQEAQGVCSEDCPGGGCGEPETESCSEPEPGVGGVETVPEGVQNPDGQPESLELIPSEKGKSYKAYPPGNYALHLGGNTRVVFSVPYCFDIGSFGDKIFIRKGGYIVKMEFTRNE